MKYLSLFFITFLFVNCSKTQSVLICGDHVCINKAEAKKYFEENLTLEVQVINKKEKKELDLVQLNLKNNTLGKREVEIVKKEKTNENVKILSKKEIKIIKQEIKKHKQSEKITKKQNKIKEIFVNQTPQKKSAVDVCTILKTCSIDEISKYLLKEGKNKKFPDITIRQ